MTYTSASARILKEGIAWMTLRQHGDADTAITRHEDGSFTEVDEDGNDIGYGDWGDTADDTPDTDDTVEIFDAIVGTFAICDWESGSIAPFPPGVAAYGSHVRHMGRDLGPVAVLCMLYNTGTRRI